MRRYFSWLDIENRPPIVIGLTLAGIYILLSSAIAITYAVKQTQFPAYVIDGIDLLGYICVMLLIFSVGRDLKTYHLERFSLLLLIIFPGFLSPVPSRIPGWVLFLFMIVPFGIAILLYLRLRRLDDLPDGKLLDLAKYIILGTSIAILFFLLANLFGAANPIDIGNLPQESLLSFIDQLIGSLTTSAAIEETLFRGFLLGCLLHKKGLRPWLAITIQALVFWLPHTYQYNNPIVLQALIPLFGITAGWLTVKSKNITSGIVAHAIYNSLLAVF